MPTETVSESGRTDSETPHEPFIDANGNGMFDPGEISSDFGLDGVSGTETMRRGRSFSPIIPAGTISWPRIH
jgi:hypothetical protein